MIIHHDLTPNTQPWKEFRNYRFGASDLGEYMTKSKISPLSSKFNDDDSVNRFSWIGHNAEPRIREMLSDRCDIHADAVIVTASFNDRIMATLDGLDDINKIIAEIKTSCLSGEAFEENMRYYCHQMSHQYYVANDPNYRVYLCVEKYTDNETSDPQFYSSTVYQAVFVGDKCYLKIVKQFLVNNNEYTEIPEDEINTESAVYDVLTFDQWLEQCEKFLADLDRHAEFFADESKNKNLELMLMSYKDVQNKLDMYEKRKEYLRDKIKEILGESDIYTYQGLYGKVSASERKNPLSESFVKEQIEARGLEVAPEYYSAFDYKKWAKDYKVQQTTSPSLTITLAKDKKDE